MLQYIDLRLGLHFVHPISVFTAVMVDHRGTHGLHCTLIKQGIIPAMQRSMTSSIGLSAKIPSHLEPTGLYQFSLAT